MTARSKDTPRIAVIGAGLAGLVAGDRLASAGADVCVIEKARGPGGRAATRRHDAWRFDHGMQYFTARSDAFQTQVARWIEAGAVARWTPRLEGDERSASSADPRGSLPDAAGRPATGGAVDSAGGPTASTPLSAAIIPSDAWFVGVPGSNAPCQMMAGSGRLRLHAGVRVERVDTTPHGPRLVIDQASGGPGRARTPPDADVVRTLEAEPFDAVLVTAPAPQIGPMFEDDPALADLARMAADVRLAPCWALMLGVERTVDVPWDVRRRSDGPVSWMARDAAKPGRPTPADGPGEAWVIHASPDWSAEHVELDPETAAERLRTTAMAAFAEAGCQPEAPVVCMAHRWRYALVTEPAREPFGWEPDAGVGVAGDWAVAGRFESAFTSGRTLAMSVAETFGLRIED